MRSLHLLLLLGAALLWAAHGRAATPQAKAAWIQARDAAAAAYQAARAKCEGIAGNAHALCIEEAKAERVRAEETARAAYEDTLDAYTDARLRIAKANFERDKTLRGGNDKEVCLTQARATRIAAEADAKADRKSIAARNQARADQVNAAYRVALEKCDAYAGAVKDQCVGVATNTYGK
jgi:hypothetical protein